MRASPATPTPRLRVHKRERGERQFHRFSFGSSEERTPGEIEVQGSFFAVLSSVALAILFCVATATNLWPMITRSERKCWQKVSTLPHFSPFSFDDAADIFAFIATLKPGGKS